MAKQNKKPQDPGFKAKKGTMPRLIRLLFTDYPLPLTVVLICLVVTAVAGAIPSAFMGKIILYIEEGLKSGLDTVYAGIAATAAALLAIFLVSLLCSCLSTRLMAIHNFFDIAFHFAH